MQVRITKTLTEAVSKRISEMQRTERSNNPLPFELSMLLSSKLKAQPFVDHLWGEHLHLRAMMPKRWCKEAPSITVNFLNVEWPVADALLSISLPCFDFTYQLHNNLNKFLLPPNHDTFRTSVTLPLESPLFDPVRDQINEYLVAVANHAAINKRWAGVHRQVMNYLSSYSSLNKAVREWEGLKRFLPQHYVDAMQTANTKTRVTQSRTAVAAENHNINFDELEAAGVIGTLLINK